MLKSEIELVEAVAKAFRAAIERCKPRLTYIVFEQFPCGACGDTCDLLGRCLGEHGSKNWFYVSARRGENTHAWIENDGIIVDITADQFDDVDTPVLVTSNRAWHEQFVVENRRPVGNTVAMPEIELELKKTYQMIMEEFGLDE